MGGHRGPPRKSAARQDWRGRSDGVTTGPHGEAPPCRPPCSTSPTRRSGSRSSSCPTLGPQHVRVRLVASGVCHSDWHIVKGEWPHIPIPSILGHEGAGIVEEIGGAVRGIAEGDHVVLSWKRNCGLCEMCQKGFPNLCDEVPDEATFPRLAGDGPDDEKTARARHLQHRDRGAAGRRDPDRQIRAARPGGADRLRRADRGGCGDQHRQGRARRLGRGLRLRRGRPQLHPGRRARRCASRSSRSICATTSSRWARPFGATHTVNAAAEDPIERIREITGGLGAHYAFEAIGLTGEPFRQAIECTRKRGVTVFVGHAPHNTPVDFDARMLMPEKT